MSKQAAKDILDWAEDMRLWDVLQGVENPLTEDDVEWLLERYPPSLIKDKLLAMQNYTKFPGNYKSARLTCFQWCRKDQQRNQAQEEQEDSSVKRYNKNAEKYGF